MLRKFTKPIGRFEAGEIHDYPLGVWRQIESNVGKPLNSFSAEVTQLVNQMPLPAAVKAPRPRF